MKLNADVVYSAYLDGYLGAPFAGAASSVDLGPHAAYALGVYWRSEPAREPEPLASVVRKVEKLLAPVESEEDKDTSWFTDPGGARLRRVEKKP